MKLTMQQITHGEEEVIVKYLEKTPDERIRLIKKGKNEGAALTRNRGIKEAKGR